MEKKKKNWKKEPIKGGTTACLCCGGTADILPLETVLYQGMGGLHITRNDKIFFMEEDYNKEWEQFKTLQEFEDIAKTDPDNDWQCVTYLPLRDAKHQRHCDGTWVLIESGLGFA